jgi:hypothetical protein
MAGGRALECIRACPGKEWAETVFRSVTGREFQCVRARIDSTRGGGQGADNQELHESAQEIVQQHVAHCNPVEGGKMRLDDTDILVGTKGLHIERALL